MELSRRSFVGSAVAVAGLGALGAMGRTAFASEAEGDDAGAATASGLFEGTARGVGGDLTVSAELSDGELGAIEKVTFNETSGLGTAAWDRVVAEMVDNQAAQVDAVTGATLSSMAIVSAVNGALEAAGAEDILAATHAHVAEPQRDMEVDVVVVGAGHGGLFAAACLAQAGKNVIVLEKTGVIGGSSLRSCALFGPEMTARAEGTDAVNQKLDEFGIAFEPFARSEGMRIPVAEDGKTPAHTFTSKLEGKLREFGGTVLVDTECTGLLTEDGAVTGVTALPLGQDEFAIKASAVILATGGWCNSPDMVAEYCPQYAGIPACCGVGSTGDAFKLVDGLDASFSFMDSGIHFYPIARRGAIHGYEPFTFPLVVDGAGNTFSDRFVDDYAAVACLAAQQDPDATYYAIYSNAEIDENDLRDSIEAQVMAGVTDVVETFEDVVSTYGLTNLEASAQANELATDDGPYYVTDWYPTLYSTYGGLDLDENAHVLTTAGAPIAGLYAVGEVAGSEAFRQIGFYGGHLFPDLVMGYDAVESILNDLA